MISGVHTSPRSPCSNLVSHVSRHGRLASSRFTGSIPHPKYPCCSWTQRDGATVRVSGKRATGEALVVKLEPCGTATARLVGPDGKPLPTSRHGHPS